MEETAPAASSSSSGGVVVAVEGMPLGGGGPAPALTLTPGGGVSSGGAAAAVSDQPSDPELANLKQEEEAARRDLLARRKASLLQRQQAARDTSAGGGSTMVATKLPESRDRPTGEGGGGGEQQTEETSNGNNNNNNKSSAANKPAAAAKEQVVRAEAVENAVRFLNHPKVKASPLGKRLAFLEHKGLNDSEIALALKRANISSDDVKQAMDLASSSSSPSSEPVATGSIVSAVAPSPPLPPRTVVPGGVLAQGQPLPVSAGWSWGARAVGALAFFALGGAVSILAAKHFFPSNAQSGSSPEPGSDKDRVDPRGGRQVEEGAGMTKADAFKAELEVLRASHTALASQVREALVAMKESTEIQKQTQTPLQSSSSREEVPSTKNKQQQQQRQHEDETIASLRTEIKTLRAMLLDTRTAESAATRASTIADLPSFSIPSASLAPSSPPPSSSASMPSASLPSWQMTPKRSHVVQPPSTSSASAGSKPSAPKPYERRAAAAKADITTTGSVPSSADTEVPQHQQQTADTAVVEQHVSPSYAEIVQAGAHEKEEGEEGS